MNKTKNKQSTQVAKNDSFVVVESNNAYQNHDDEDYVVIHKDITGYSNITPLGGGISSSDGGLYNEF